MEKVVEDEGELQKINYLDNEKRYLGKITNIFHIFKSFH